MPSQERHSFLDWIRLKHYQFLTTFGLYMMTPRERLLFRTFPLLSPDPDHAHRTGLHWTGLLGVLGVRAIQKSCLKSKKTF
ncbi:hypothetical protein L228DRAFT_249153 [Xylona heveae TC161]|uniref:Uncharacterized protein n=1 Tax=Xylona heveae (strain CBS 132557 / TC161) TaxID=1328760 RepID=A0A165FT51_XYLHT|nr:hypothetical protein L228DRAFT_249153 [Xylona heveae TC161]KZF21342.1 hypothetical protein L228DRAFT_249153 [Xylona heveae TC161]